MGDGETKDEAIDDVKKAFGCFLEVNMECQPKLYKKFNEDSTCSILE